jgi:hypothetical protein
MAHGIIHGPRHGAVHGARHFGLPLDNPGIPGITRDAASGIYCPANAAEWTLMMAAAGVGSGNPASVYNCQESSGTLADSIGAITLPAAGTGHLYQQTVGGWQRRAVATTDGTANQRWVNGTTAPNPSLTSTMVMVFVALPAAAPAAARDVCAVATNADIRLNTTGRLRVVFGAQADCVNSHLGIVTPIVMQINNTATTATLYTKLEKFTGTYVLPTNASLLSLGGQTTAAGNIQHLYACQFTGAAAEMTSGNLKNLLQTMGWGTIPWS